MPKSHTVKSRKTRADKFPPTLHKTGPYCKKIKGKIYYFSDNKQAYQKYLEQARPSLISIFVAGIFSIAYLFSQGFIHNLGEVEQRNDVSAPFIS